MLRRLWAVTAGLSLLLCLISGAYWLAARDSFIFAEPYHTEDWWTLTISCDRGEFSFMFAPSGPDYARPANFNPNRREIIEEVPCWQPTVAFAVLPTLWVIFAVTKKRQGQGFEVINKLPETNLPEPS